MPNRNLYLELDRLKWRVATLQSRCARATAHVSQQNAPSPGEIITISNADTPRFVVQPRTIAATKDEAISGVYTFPGDVSPQPARVPVMVMPDRAGNRCLLPRPGGVCLVQDLGSGQGKRVEIDTTGTVATPPDSETLAMVVSEPASKFLDSTPALKAGRIYFAQRLTNFATGTGYYLVYLAGHGPAVADTELEFETDSYTISLAISHDAAGKIIEVSGSWELNAVVEDDFYFHSDLGAIYTDDCYLKFRCLKMTPGCTSYKARFWDSYDGDTKTYSGYHGELSAQYGLYHNSSETTSSYYFYVPCVGTGVINKASRFIAGDDPYIEVTKEVQLIETGRPATAASGVATSGSTTQLYDTTKDFLQAAIYPGDTIVIDVPARTARILGINKTRITFAAGAAVAAGANYTITRANTNISSITLGNLGHAGHNWDASNFAPFTVHQNYTVGSDSWGDPSPETTDYVAIEFSISPTRGVNDDANDYIIISAQAGGDVPGWGVNALWYTTECAYVEGHESVGGRIYFSRKSNDIWYWNGAAWEHPAAGTTLVGSYAGVGCKIGEDWYSKRFSAAVACATLTVTVAA